MPIPGKVIAVRILKWFNRHRRDDTKASMTDNSFVHRANDVMRKTLPVLSAIAPAIPVAGTQLKASIDALLVVLNSINTRGQNKEDAALLTRRLYRLEGAISAAPPATPSAQDRRDELSRKLDAVSDRLKRLHVNSVLGSADVAGAIRNCMREIDEHERDYTVPSLMRIEYIVQTFLDNQGQLSSLVQEDKVFVTDATGRRYKLLVDQCESREQFMGVLKCYFKNTDKDRALLDFIDRGAYDLYIEAGTGTTQLDEWSGVRAGTRIVMSAIFEQSRVKEKYRCPRPQCGVWNDCKEANDGWINCVCCPGRFQITNADSKSNNSSPKFSQNAQGSTTQSADGCCQRLDFIQIFHLRQWELSQSSSDSSTLSVLARSKLHTSVSGKDSCSLHRWVLLKNSILHN